MASNSNYAILRVPAPAGEWTPICAWMDCNCFSLRSANKQDLRIRTDQADANTEDLLEGGTQEGLTAPPESGNLYRSMRFRSGVAICYVQPVSNVADVVVAKFVR